MKPQWFLVLAVSLLLAAQTPKEDASKDDLKKLEGTWEVVQMERAGRALSSEQVKSLNFQVTFKEKQIRSRTGSITTEGTYQIDATKSPRTIDVTDRAGKLERGIYKLDDDTLTVVTAPTGADAPTSLEPKSGSSQMLLVLKRVKP
jgi:uncharacterized protein (TIGR03067 family)